MITVSDNGIGIEQQNISKLWSITEKYTTTGTNGETGSGFGLLLCKEFVEKHGGTIWVESEFGKGSEFKFTIPMVSTIETDNSKLSDSEFKNNPFILIAEDEEMNFILIQEMLNCMNYNLIHARNGKEAIDILNSNNNIVLILMDVKMPVMDGYTAAKQIKEFRPNIPIIAQSAYVYGNAKENYSGIAFDDFISKPINAVELKQKVLKYKLPT